ncbi:DsrE/DsrF/DrsH-like family protein [Rubrivirga sp. IMCC43871]|uniref:DsrE/DsrF/DrsH-like family protein n=1 Tax=Rubrivirga sp. IMCC43871 TaxID=3391575 RepID=UPI00398F97F1
MELTPNAAALTVPTPPHPVRQVLIICARGTLEDVYAGLIMANGALMEGKKAKMFFTFFGLEAIRKGRQDHLHTATVGNPAFMQKLPTMVGGLPGFEALASAMMRREMDALDIPPVSEFMEIIDASGGEIYACKLAADMFHLGKDDLIDEVRGIITVGDMYALAEGEGTQILFI